MYSDRILIFLFPLAVACLLVLAGCNTSSPLDADEGSSLLIPHAPLPAASACPTFDDICVEITTQLNQDCPVGRDYPNWGQFNSCERKIVGRILDDHVGCFSDDELKDIRGCIQERRRQLKDNEPEYRFAE